MVAKVDSFNGKGDIARFGAIKWRILSDCITSSNLNENNGIRLRNYLFYPAVFDCINPVCKLIVGISMSCKNKSNLFLPF